MADPTNKPAERDPANANAEAQLLDVESLEVQDLLDFSFDEVTLVKRLSRSCGSCS